MAGDFNLIRSASENSNGSINLTLTDFFLETAHLSHSLFFFFKKRLTLTDAFNDTIHKFGLIEIPFSIGCSPGNHLIAPFSEPKERAATYAMNQNSSPGPTGNTQADRRRSN